MPFPKCLALLLAIGLSSVTWAQGAQKASPPLISITIEPARSVVKAGSEAKISIVLTNVSGREMLITWDNGNQGELDYDINVLDRNGHEPPDTQYFRAVRGKDSSFPDGKTQLLIARSTGLRQLN